MTRPNVDLLHATLAHVEQHPEEHDQASWTPLECDTAMCFAGHAVITLSGGVQATIDGEPWYGLVKAEADDYWHDVHQFDNGDVVRVEDRARRLLGLTHAQAASLFHPNNLVDRLRRVVGELCRASD